MTKEFTCERDGIVMRAETDDELIAQVQAHVGQAHPDLVGKLTLDDILAAIRAKPAQA